MGNSTVNTKTNLPYKLEYKQCGVGYLFQI